MPKEKNQKNEQQNQPKLKDAYLDFIAARMIKEAEETDATGLDKVLEELNDLDLDEIKAFASEFYFDELADLLSYETIAKANESNTPPDLLNSSELDEKVLQEYTDHLYEAENQNNFRKAMEKDAADAYRIFIYECIKEELNCQQVNPSAYEDYNRAFNDLQTLEQLREFANNYPEALEGLGKNYAPYSQEYDGPDTDNILLGWYNQEKKYAELDKIRVPFYIEENFQEESAPEEMSDKEKKEVLDNVEKFFDELHKTEEQEKTKAAEEAAMEKLRQMQQKDKKLDEQERMEQEEQLRKEAGDREIYDLVGERLDRERAKQEKEQAEREKRIQSEKKADERERKNEERLNKMRKELEDRRKEQQQLNAEKLKREEDEKKAAQEDKKRRDLEELLKEELAEENIEKEPEDVIDESLGGKSLEELGYSEHDFRDYLRSWKKELASEDSIIPRGTRANQEIDEYLEEIIKLKEPNKEQFQEIISTIQEKIKAYQKDADPKMIKIDPAKSLEISRRSKTVDSFDSKLNLKTETLNAAVFKDELRRLAKDLEKTVHIGQRNTQGFKDLQAALKEIRETKGEFKEEAVTKEAFMNSDLIRNAMRACSQYAFDHTEKTLDATQMQRLKIMSRIANTIYMAEKDIEPNSIAGMKEKLSEKYNNAKCIATLKSSKSTPEQKKEAKYAMLSFTTIGDKGHRRSQNVMESIEAKFNINPEFVRGAMMQTLKKPGAEFLKELDGLQNVSKARKSTGLQK